jgi:hypothetical protein
MVLQMTVDHSDYNQKPGASQFILTMPCLCIAHQKPPTWMSLKNCKANLMHPPSMEPPSQKNQSIIAGGIKIIDRIA